MIKNAIIFILSLFLPLIIIFTVYRATLDKGPFQLKYVFDVVANEFLTSSDLFSDLVNDLSDSFNGILEGLDNLYNPDYQVIEIGDSIFADILNFLVKFFIVPWQMMESVVYLFIDLIGLLIIFILDFFSLLKVISSFVFGISPYPVNPYFPVP